MTHYTENYGDLKEPEKSQKAIKDIISYLGKPKYDELTKVLKEQYTEHKPTRAQFHLMLSFVGVSGFPVEAWYDKLWPSMKSKPFIGKVRVELLTIRDKERRITVPRPTEYYVQVWFENLCIREIVLEDKAQARAWYDRIHMQLQNQAENLKQKGTT